MFKANSISINSIFIFKKKLDNNQKSQNTHYISNISRNVSDTCSYVLSCYLLIGTSTSYSSYLS